MPGGDYPIMSGNKRADTLLDILADVDKHLGWNYAKNQLVKLFNQSELTQQKKIGAAIRGRMDVSSEWCRTLDSVLVIIGDRCPPLS